MHNKVLEEGSELNLQFEKRNGLLPVIVQEAGSKDILMLGYTNIDAFERTIQSGKATFWSTSRQKLWTKGETSGDYLLIEEVKVDCDQDSLIYLVKLAGSGSCHTKNSHGETRKSCFYRVYDENKQALENLDP